MSVYHSLRMLLLMLGLVIILPISLFPFISATVGGVMFVFWENNRVLENVDKFLYETKDILSDWGVGGGAQTFRQFQDHHNDMATVRANSDDWTEKLGYCLPDQWGTFLQGEDSLSIDNHVDLDSLMITPKNFHPSAVREEQWLYISNSGWPVAFNPWDQAFRYVVEYAKGDPHLNQTRLFFAECGRTGGFMCGVWHTRTPALVHFKAEQPQSIEEANLNDESLTWCSTRYGLRPVTARIIEFPLEDVYTGLPLGVFPSREEQLLAVMATPGLYEQWEPFERAVQVIKRFNDYMHDEMPESFWRADSWVETHISEPLGLDEAVQYFHSWLFALTTLCTTVFGLLPYRIAKEAIDGFFGKPLRGDEIVGDMNEYAPPAQNFWDPIMGDFLGGLNGDRSGPPSSPGKTEG